ncbi:hypothetical protein AGMMS50225_08710 [Betaproteobacteria bacterium]|nr:hypothetical protein AGMMS50225_08710 [Betaproteobacteria bacterium]
MIKSCFLSVLCFLCLSVCAHAEGGCVNDSAAIIKVFDQGMALNEQFKKSVGGNYETHRLLSVQSSKFYEERVVPCVERVVEILSRRDSPRLAHKLLLVTISFGNYADETISWSLGSIFGANPGVLENSLKQFSGLEYNWIVWELHAGWLNVRHGNKFSRVAKDRERRLQKLRLGTDSSQEYSFPYPPYPKTQ